MRTARVVLQEGPRSLHLAELPLPPTGPDDGLLHVDACGLCGTDLEQFAGTVAETLSLPYPLVPGHEIVGTITELGSEAAERWGVATGDRVAVQPQLPCGRCRACREGRSCSRHPTRIYGLIPCSVPPGLWGGYADHVYLSPDAVLHPLPPQLDPEVAVLFNPLANAIEWSVRLAGTRLGDTAVVLGPGQRGLACVVALRMRGAAGIVVTGLGRDRHKLALAESLGATATVDVERHDVVAAVAELTGGAMADVVVDTTPDSTDALLDAIRIARPGATIVLGGVKGRTADGFSPDDLILKDLTLRGGQSASHESYAQAVDLLTSRPELVARLHTHRFGLGEAERALATLAGEEGVDAVAVCLVPESPA